MAEFGPEFVNVHPEVGEQFMTPFTGESLPAAGSFWDDLVAQADANALGLQRAVNRAHDDHGDGGGYVYIPPGRYYIGRPRRTRVMGTFDPWGAGDDGIAPGLALDVPDVLVYPDVTLWFAPGAVLVPMNFQRSPADHTVPMPGRPEEDLLVRIEIQGDLETGLQQIFDTFLNPDVSNIVFRGDEDRLRTITQAGLVLLTGTRLREVRPEWWGAQPFSLASNPAEHRRFGFLNAAAFQAAIDAAHTHRRRPLRREDDRSVVQVDGAVQWWHLPAIPVVAQSSYRLGRPLQVGVTDADATAPPTDPPGLRAPNPDAFVLRGERAPGSLPTFAAGVDWPKRGDAAMLIVRGISSFALRDVFFNGERNARMLLRFEPGPDGGHAEVSGCTFLGVEDVDGATLVGLRSVALEVPWAPVPGRVNVAFVRCHLVPDSAPEEGLGARLFRTYASVRAVRIDVDDETRVEFRGCLMSNAAEPLIDAWRGHFALNETTLHAHRVRHDPEYTKQDGMGHFLNRPSGTDVFLRAPRSVDGHPDAPASFTAREVESQSYQFLATFEDAEEGPRQSGRRPTGDRSACVLFNVHHVCVAGGGADAVPDERGEFLPLNRRDHRPSIYWAGPGVRGSHLLSVACRWTEQYEVEGTELWSGPLGGIRLANGQTGDLYHLGNTCAFNAGGFASTNTRGVRPERIILPQYPNGTLPTERIRTLPLDDTPVRTPR